MRLYTNDVLLKDRKRLLAGIIPRVELRVRLVKHVPGRGMDFFTAACRHDLEGIVAKWKDGTYQEPRVRGEMRCMLYEFITTYCDAIIVRAREKLTARPWPTASRHELDHGAPLFLTQLAEVLRTEEAGGAYAPGDLGAGATLHGRDLLALGFTVSQVVHDYGDICQAITELAVEQNAPITTEDDLHIHADFGRRGPATALP